MRELVRRREALSGAVSFPVAALHAAQSHPCVWSRPARSTADIDVHCFTCAMSASPEFRAVQAATIRGLTRQRHGGGASEPISEEHAAPSAAFSEEEAGRRTSQQSLVPIAAAGSTALIGFLSACQSGLNTFNNAAAPTRHAANFFAYADEDEGRRASSTVRCTLEAASEFRLVGQRARRGGVPSSGGPTGIRMTQQGCRHSLPSRACAVATTGAPLFLRCPWPAAPPAPTEPSADSSRSHRRPHRWRASSAFAISPKAMSAWRSSSCPSRRWAASPVDRSRSSTHGDAGAIASGGRCAHRRSTSSVSRLRLCVCGSIYLG